MSGYDAMQAIRTLAGSMRGLQRQAVQQYLPVVDDILRTRSRDTQYPVQIGNRDFALDCLVAFSSTEGSAK